MGGWVVGLNENKANSALLEAGTGAGAELGKNIVHKHNPTSTMLVP